MQSLRKDNVTGRIKCGPQYIIVHNIIYYNTVYYSTQYYLCTALAESQAVLVKETSRLLETSN